MIMCIIVKTMGLYIHLGDNVTLKRMQHILTLIEHCLLSHNSKSMCENAKWHL